MGSRLGLVLSGLVGLAVVLGDRGAAAQEAPPRQDARRSLRSLQHQQELAEVQDSSKDISISLPGVGSISVGSGGVTASSSSSSGGGVSDSNSPINYSDYIHGRRINTTDGANPVCRMQSSMDRDGTICLAAASWLAFTKMVPPPLGVGYASRAPVDPDGKLPGVLKDQRPLPATIDPQVVKDEKPTYYWYYRLLLNFYSELVDWTRSGTDDVDLQVPPEWKHQRFYNTSMRRTAPLGVSYMKDDGHFILLIRGTQFSGEWEKDFEYYFEDADKTAKFFPGRVHAGFFSVFTDMVSDVADEINARQPARVTVAGHSLGGAVANLFGSFIANSTIRSNVTTDVVTFGAPQVGDADFVADFNAKVNNRHVAYRGAGSTGDNNYEVGDFIAQAPCGEISNCPLLSEFSARREGEVYNYTAVGGDVPFVYSDLRNRDTWRSKGDVTSFFYAPIANHVCSYLCFTARSAGDRDEKCFFPLDWEPDVLVRYRCPILM